jgi:hypothetical protein
MEENERKKPWFGLTGKEFLAVYLISEVVASGYRIISAWRKGGDVSDEIGRLAFGLVVIGVTWLVVLAARRRTKKH